LLLGVLTVGLAVVLTVLVWRLTTGPISLAFLTPYFESAFNVPEAEFRIELEDTILTWAGWDQSLDIRLRGAKVIGSDRKTIADIPELAVSLSAEALMHRKVLPRSLSIFGPRLNIVRREDGQLELGIAQNGNQRTHFNKQLAEKVFSLSEPGRPLAHLKSINIIGGHVVIDDRQLEVKWEAPEADIMLVRREGGFSAKAELSLKAGENVAALLIDGKYDAKSQQAEITVGFADLNPSAYAQLSKKLKILDAFDMPVSGTLAAKILPNGDYRSLEFSVAGAKGRMRLTDPFAFDLAVNTASLSGVYDREAGQLNIEEAMVDLGKDGRLKLPKPFAHHIPVQKITASASYNANSDRMEIKNLRVQTPGPEAEAALTVQEIGGDYTFEFSGTSRNVEADQLSSYWPKGLGDFTRSWILANLSVGSSPQANARVTGRWNSKKGVEIHSLTGDMSLRDLTVDFLPPMPKAVHNSGHAKFDKTRFEVQINAGEVEGLSLNRGSVVFTGLDQYDQFADVKLDIDGSLQDVLSFIDKEPLGFTKTVGLTAANVEGKTSTNVKLDFLLDRQLTADRVRASVKSKLHEVSVKNIAQGFDLQGANLVLEADNKGMTVKGFGKFGDINSAIEWRENFRGEGKFRSRYKLSAIVTDKQWRNNLKLNFVPFTADYLNGKFGAAVVATIDHNGKGLFKANLDLKESSLSLPEFQWRKSTKVAAKSKIEAIFSSKGFLDIPRIVVQGGGMDFSGRADFDDSGKFQKLVIQKLLFGDSDITGFVERKTKGWIVDIAGKRLDLAAWLAKEDEQTERNRGQELDLNINALTRVKIYPGKFLENVTAKMKFDGLVWRRVNVTAGLGPGETLVIDVLPKGGKRELTVVSNDAGAALRKFELYDNLIGGRLTVNAVYDSMDPESRLSGTAKIDNFRIVKAPVLAQLLNIASLTGILENLGEDGFGLTFEKLEAPFVKQYGIVNVKDVEANGISLGLTATGNLDTQTKLIDLKGTVVPAYIVNTALTHIPVIGQLLSGGEKGGGVFAARYTMTGDVQNPDISTNPLSTLTPGFLRNLFDIFDNVKVDPPEPEKSE